jgi:hypothetical protein
MDCDVYEPSRHQDLLVLEHYKELLDAIMGKTACSTIDFACYKLPLSRFIRFVIQKGASREYLFIYFQSVDFGYLMQDFVRFT